MPESKIFSDDCSTFIGQYNGGKEITSPQYPNPYPAGADCTWIISSSSWQRIELLFQHFDVGSKAGESQSCGGDFLKVLDGPHHWSSALGTYCNGVHPTVVKSTNEVLRIRFHSEGISSSHKGFQLQLLRFTSGTVSLRKAGEGYQNVDLQIGGNFLGSEHFYGQIDHCG